MKTNFLIYLIITSVLISCSKNTDLQLNSNDTPIVDTDTKVINEEERQPLIELTKDDELKIFVRADGAPGMFLNSQNEVEGFYVELEKAIMKEMDQKYRFIPYTNIEEVIHDIIMGNGHSALSVPDVPDYQLASNISTTYEVLKFVIFLPSESNEIVPDNKYDAIKFLYGKKVGVQAKAHIYQLLREHPEIELIQYPTTTVAMEALNNGEVDAVPEVPRIGRYYANERNWDVEPHGPSIFELNIGTCFSKRLSQSVVYRYNVALQKLIDNGYVEDLNNEYFGI